MAAAAAAAQAAAQAVVALAPDGSTTPMMVMMMTMMMKRHQNQSTSDAFLMTCFDQPLRSHALHPNAELSSLGCARLAAHVILKLNS